MTSAPQAGQVSASARPHPPQNRKPAGFSTPQFGQRIVLDSVRRSAGTTV